MIPHQTAKSLFTPYSETENFELEWQIEGEHSCLFGQDATLDFTKAGFRYGSDRFPNQAPDATASVPIPGLKNVPIKKTPGSSLPTSFSLTESYEVTFTEGPSQAKQCPERPGKTAVGTILEKKMKITASGKAPGSSGSGMIYTWDYTFIVNCCCYSGDGVYESSKGMELDLSVKEGNGTLLTPNIVGPPYDGKKKVDYLD